MQMGVRRIYEVENKSQGRQGSWLRIFNPANQNQKTTGGEK